MKRPTLTLAFATLLATFAITPAASADQCSSSGGVVDNGLVVDMSCGTPSAEATDPTSSATATEPAFVDFKWVSPCLGFDPAAASTGPLDCPRARVCPDPLERLWILWAQTRMGTWEPITSQCFGRPPTVADTPRPTVTPALVLNALRRIGLPALKAQTQPADKTLVNFDTIFYAQPQTFRRTITLLGRPVEVEARPASYLWHHGDGTTNTTTSPGAPYPAKDIVHRYTDAHRTVGLRVDVAWSARFRVAGGTWQDIDQTVTTTGPTSNLRISEATAVLSGSYG